MSKASWTVLVTNESRHRSIYPIFLVHFKHQQVLEALESLSKKRRRGSLLHYVRDLQRGLHERVKRLEASDFAEAYCRSKVTDSRLYRIIG
jgi:hypothetical protein